MGKLKLDITHTEGFISEQELKNMTSYVEAAHNSLHDGSGAGADYTGWLDLPSSFDKDEFKRIKECAEKIKDDSDILIVVGIGGSYLGARAVIDALSHNYYNLLNKEKRPGSAIIYAGNSISSTYLADVLEIIGDKEISINVVSKSGTTTEPALAFRVLKEFMEKRYGKKEAANRIYATTDKSRGALKKLSDSEGYETFVIPDNVGGRFSVLTAVGLLPIAVSGVNIDALMDGARQASEEYRTADMNSNDCNLYAAARNILYRKGMTTEILVNYEPNLHFFNEWWKQLYGESEGKGHMGIFPAAVDFTTDLHSMGQYIQDGKRFLFETVLQVNNPKKNMLVKTDQDDLDGLNFLVGRDFDYINKMAAKGTIKAHVDGGTPNMVVEIPELDANSFGRLIFFFEKACAISGYLLGVNPFDQPGVETYKKNMFELLGKPGY